MRISLLATSVIGLLLICLLASCGTKNVGVLGAAEADANRGGAGVTLDGFEVVRYNVNGQADPALNRTLNLDVVEEGNVKTLVIKVNDAEFTNSVCVDVKYDNNLMHPTGAEFNNLIGGADEAINICVLSKAGIAGLGEVAIGDHDPGLLNGRFAEISFVTGADRTASAAGGPHMAPNGLDRVFLGQDCLVGAFDTAAKTASMTWFAAWHIGDTDQNSEVNIADLQPIGVFLGQKPTADNASWNAATADVDGNDEVNINDLTDIGRYYGEKTTDYTLQISDDTDTATPTDVDEFDWDPLGVPPYRDSGIDPVLNDLSTVFTSWTYEWSDAPYAALAPMDVNGNKILRAHVTPVADGASITSAVKFRDLGFNWVPEQEPVQVAIQDFKFQAVGVDDGAGNDIFDGVGNTCTIKANEDIAFELTSISGTVDGTIAFDGDTPPGDMTAEEWGPLYTIAFEAAREHLEWTFSNGTVANFKRTSNFVVLNSGSFGTITGDPGAGVVFPDDDPDSSGTAAEGRIDLVLPTATDYPNNTQIVVLVSAQRTGQLHIDVTTDEEAATFTGWLLDGEENGTEVPRVVTTDLNIALTWGTGVDPSTIDPTTTTLQMCELNGGVVDPDDESTIEFLYEDFVPDPPLDPDPVLNAGEYTFTEREGDYSIDLKIPGIYLQADKFYTFRFHNGVEWTSLNRPDNVFETGPVPPSQPLLTIPDEMGEDIDQIQIFYPDPMVRRNGKIFINEETGEVTAQDPAAFDDILKTGRAGGTTEEYTGFEFEISALPGGGGSWPTVVCIERTDGQPTYPDPNTITGPNDPNHVSPQVRVIERQKGRIVVDVLVLTTIFGPGEPDHYYGYKLFNQDTSGVGTGLFKVVGLSPTVPTLDFIEWGVNAWNRQPVDTCPDIGSESYVSHQVNGDTILTAQPDVLWFHFGGGYVYDWNIADGDANVEVEIKNTETSQDKAYSVGLRIVGVGANDTYIGIHPVIAADYIVPLEPGAPGILQPGKTFEITLHDKGGAGTRETSPDRLTCVNSNPNS